MLTPSVLPKKMKSPLLLLCLFAPPLLFPQGTLMLRQGSLQSTVGTMMLSNDDQRTIREQQFQRFAVDWADDIENDYTLYAPPSFSTLKISLGFDWTTKAESKFTRLLDIGLSHTSIRGFSNQREHHQVLSSQEDQTTLGVFRYDSVRIRQQQISHKSFVVGLHGQLRYYTKEEHWLKGYSGVHVFAGVAFDATTEVLEASGLYDKYYLDGALINDQIPFFAFDRRSGQGFTDPAYWLARLSIPLGIEARLWQSATQGSAFSFFIEGQFGGAYMSGTYDGLRPFYGISVGFRYRFR